MWRLRTIWMNVIQHALRISRDLRLRALSTAQGFIDCPAHDHSDCKFRGGTVPAGGFQPTRGLFNVHGNVHAWCADVWHIILLLPPTDGSAWIQGGDDKFANGPRRLLVPSLCLSSGVRNLRFPVGHNVIGRRRRTGLFRLGSRTAHQVWAKTEAGGAPSARSRPYGS